MVAIERLLPGISWQTDVRSLRFPQRAGPELARLAYRKIYGRDARPELEHDIVVRDEYLGWVPKDLKYVERESDSKLPSPPRPKPQV